MAERMIIGVILWGVGVELGRGFHEILHDMCPTLWDLAFS